MEVTLLFFSLISGFLNGIGSSGGMLFMSAMLLNGFHPIVATATNKVIALIGSFGALYNYWGHSDSLKSLKYLLVFSVVGVLVGSMIVLSIEEMLIGKVYTLLTFVLLILLLFSQKIKLKGVNKRYSDFIIGTVSGVYNGFFGPGTIVVTSLQLRMLANFNNKKSLSTAVLINTLTNAIACLVLGVGVLAIFDLDLSLLLCLLLSNVAGQFAGSKMAIKTNAKYIDIVSKVTLIALLIVLLYEYWF